MSHYCWSCNRSRANEKFSGKGRRRHICKDCQKLSKEELQFRQAERDIDRLLNDEGFVKRRQRRNFQKFLNHESDRIREYAERIQHRQHEERMAWRARQEEMAASEQKWQSMLEEYLADPPEFSDRDVPF